VNVGPIGPYEVLAWDASSVSIGTLHGGDPELRQVAGGWLDIRNCAAAPDGTWLLVSGVDRRSGKHGLWRVDRENGTPSALLEAAYLLHAAVDFTGLRVAYTAPPSRSRSDTSLHLLELATSASRLLVEGSVETSCVPSWRTPGRILFHTDDRQVIELDLDSGRLNRLFAGEQPVAAPDGSRIAYRAGSAVLVAGTAGPARDVSPRRGLLRHPYRGSMSWSPDGRLLMLARTGGTLGYELDFFLLDVTTRHLIQIKQRHLIGCTFAQR
jgi:hypothetical protein